MCTQTRHPQMLGDAHEEAAALRNVFGVASLQREGRGAPLHDSAGKSYGPEAGRKSKLAVIMGWLKEKKRGNVFQTR